MRKFSISFLHRLTGNHWNKKTGKYRYVWQTCLLFTSDRGELTNIHLLQSTVFYLDKSN